jgi:hypothetical protein
MPLPDPRRYGPGDASDPLLRLAREGQGRELAAALRELAAQGRDAEIRELLSVAPSRDVYARLWQALCAAIEKPQGGEAVAARVFAIPWVIVCGGGVKATLSGVLPGVAELVRVLETKGVFGTSRNVGVGNVLVAIETIEAMRPSEILQWAQEPAMRDVPPAPIDVLPGAEEVHVRLLLGAAIASANAPDVVETGSNIAAWGTPALRAMSAQLATSGVQILPMPRPPAGLYSAAYAGRRSGVEAAFNLFMSNGVRRFRASIGDPDVTLSSHAGAEIRVTLSTPLDDELIEGFRWPLHPADDLPEIEGTLTSMIGECRLPEPQIAGSVLPDYSGNGALLFPKY